MLPGGLWIGLGEPLGLSLQAVTNMLNEIRFRACDGRPRSKPGHEMQGSGRSGVSSARDPGGIQRLCYRRPLRELECT